MGKRAILPLSLLCLILVIFAIIVYVTHPPQQVWARSAHGASRTVELSTALTGFGSR